MKWFSRVLLTFILLFFAVNPLSIFAVGEQPNNLSADNSNFCSNITAASFTYGSMGNTEIPLDIELYQDTNSTRIFYVDGEREIELTDKDGESVYDSFYSLRITLKQDYLTQLFTTLSVTKAKLTVDFVGTAVNNLPYVDQQSFEQNDSNSAHAFSLEKQTYDFTDLKPLYDRYPPDRLNSKKRFNSWLNGYYQVQLEYTFSEQTTKFNCPIRFVVSPPILKYYCDVTLHEEGVDQVQSRQIAEGSTEYVFPIKNNSNYTLTFSEIDSNTLTIGRPSCNWGSVCTTKSLILNSGSEEIDSCENVTSQGTFIQTCGVKDRSSSDFEKFQFEFGPGQYQFNASEEGQQYVLTLKDGGGFPKCRNVRLIAGLNDIESRVVLPTGTPSRELTDVDKAAYASTGKDNEQIAIADTVALCETIPASAICGKYANGNSISCMEKCVLCTINLTADEQSELDSLMLADMNGSLAESDLSRMSELQQKANGLSSTHVWTGLGCFPTDITGIIATIFTTLVGILGGFILLCIIFEGIRIMTSAGNPEALKKAQEAITSCVLGFIVVLFSVLILRIIGVDILKLPWFG